MSTLLDEHGAIVLATRLRLGCLNCFLFLECHVTATHKQIGRSRPSTCSIALAYIVLLYQQKLLTHGVVLQILFESSKEQLSW